MAAHTAWIEPSQAGCLAAPGGGGRGFALAAKGCRERRAQGRRIRGVRRRVSSASGKSQSHSTEMSLYPNAVVGDAIDGQIKFRRKARTLSGSTRPAPAGDKSRTTHGTIEYRPRLPSVAIRSPLFIRRSAR
jgi:hypothetical protein